MKILHVTGNYTPQGGVEQYILSASRLLASQGHTSVIVYTEQSAHTILDGAWPAHHIEVGEDVAAQLQRVLDVEEPDVAYVHHVSSAALIEAVACNLPAVAYVHGFVAVCPGLAKCFRRGDRVCGRAFGWGCAPMHYLRRCSAALHPRTVARLMRNTAMLRQALLKLPRFLVGSRYMADLLAQNGFPAERVSAVPPHFLPGNITPTYTPAEDPEAVLFAGRLEIEKGLPYLLRALAQIHPMPRLIVAGDGTMRLAYENLARQLGIADRVEFCGWLGAHDLNSLYQRCAVEVMPSVFPEPFGKVGIEALAQGRPVVAFDVGGISDWLDDGVNGFLVEPVDSRALADKIDQLLRDESLRTRLGRAGQASVVQQYSASQHLASLEAVLEVVRSEYG